MYLRTSSSGVSSANDMEMGSSSLARIFCDFGSLPRPSERGPAVSAAACFSVFDALACPTFAPASCRAITLIPVKASPPASAATPAHLRVLGNIGVKAPSTEEVIVQRTNDPASRFSPKTHGRCAACRGDGKTKAASVQPCDALSLFNVRRTPFGKSWLLIRHFFRGAGSSHDS